MRSTAGFEHEMLKASPISAYAWQANIGAHTSDNASGGLARENVRLRTSSPWVRSHLHIHALVIRLHEQYSPYE